MWPGWSGTEYGGMNLLEILTVLGAVALVAAHWLPAAARPRFTVAAGAVFVLSAIALCVTGIRWQLLPVLAGGLVAVPFAFSPLVRARWWLALPGSVFCVCLITAGPVTAWAFPVPVFPTPSGNFAVGTRVLQWTDPDRPETFTADPRDHRTVVAQLWYPANAPADAPRAQYLGRTVSEALAGGVGLPGFLFDGVPRARTHAIPDAPVAVEGGRFPVVLFSPGSSGVRTQNTAWAEEIASHGYVVVALDHPYDSAAAVLADGRTITSATSSTGDRDSDDRLADDWTSIRAADLSFALTRLGADPLTARLDTSRVTVTGHSMGGAAALLAARRDHRFTAVINLDGYPRGPLSPLLDQPTLALTQAVTPATDPRYLPRLTEVLTRGTATNYRLTIPGAAHLTFTDGPLYLPPVPSIVGSLGRVESPRVVAAASLAFLDSVLRKGSGDLAGALSRYGELTVFRPGNGR